MGIDLRRYVRTRALLVGILCGFAGVAVDLDHIPKYIFQIPLPTIYIHLWPFDAAKFGPYRPLHPGILIISSCAFACIGGLLVQHSVMPVVKSKIKNLILWAQQRIVLQIVEE